MHVSTKRHSKYPLIVRLFFRHQIKKYGAVLEPAKVWGRIPKLFIAVALLYGVIDRKKSRIHPAMRSLVTVRVSQINHCAFCVDINSHTLIKRSGTEAKVKELDNWRYSALFTDQEKAVLEYTEAVTYTNQNVTPEMIEKLREYYDENGLVELTALISFQNMSSKFNAALDIPAQGFCKLPKNE